MTCYACSFFIPGETFSRRQQVAAVVSLVGVVLIARPFRSSKAGSTGGDGGDESPDQADAYHHVLATIVASIGVLGAAGAYTSIRMIGRRAHPLVSVTYFSSVTTIISLLAMLILPSVEFRVPTTSTEWAFMVGLGVCGFLLQFLLTAGLSYVPPRSVMGGGRAGAGKGKGKQGSKATSMVYTQMLFALFYDKVVWGTTLDGVAWVGSGLILACAVYVAVMQEGARVKGGENGDGDDAKVQRGGGEGEREGEGRGEESVQSSAQ
jgi:drug/metabolite transporter (DMT)-like permease